MSKQNSRVHLNPPKDALEIPNLTIMQKQSFDWFVREGIKDVFQDISPIQDFNNELYDLSFEDYHFEEPKLSPDDAIARKISYEATLRAKVKLVNKVTGKTQTQEIFMGDMPIMTDASTFIVSGMDKVVVSQLVRSPGIFFTKDKNEHFGAKVIPSRGAWLEYNMAANGVLTVKIDNKRKLPLTTFLRALGYSSDTEIKKLFKDVTDEANDYIQLTLDKDITSNTEEALLEVYKRVRPGDLASAENAKEIIETLFRDPKRYDLSDVGRYKVNKTLKMNSKDNRLLSNEDLVETVRQIVHRTNLNVPGGDIDHLSNRRLKMTGEQIQKAFRNGLLRTERIIKERMTVADPETITPAGLVNVRPVTSSVKEFFNKSQLCQLMQQENPLTEVSHKRRLNALGPGGLSKERAGFEVRDVHRTHYGRICPIETPEGPNVGLVSNLAIYSRVNKFGFLETPYRKVVVKGKKALVTDEIVYLDPIDDDEAIIAPASTPINDKGFISIDRVPVRGIGGEAEESNATDVQYVDVSPKQIMGVAASLIPFIEHNLPHRALMGANMQKQTVPLVQSESPIVGTGMERKVATDSGLVITALKAGKVVSADAKELIVKYKGDSKATTYKLQNFKKSNQKIAIHQKVKVTSGTEFKKGATLVDTLATQDGELALGQNVLVAFMSYRGLGFEDAIIISERLAQNNKYTSIHVEEHTIDLRDTKLGPEVFTRDIPNVSEEALKDLDENGIIRVGATVKSGDILVGKITPKGEAELSAEERLLRAIFGEKARDIKDSSLKLPHGEFGKVVDVKIFRGKEVPKETSGVLEEIHVSVAQMRKISVGDKMAGRYGNKGVISVVLPVEDMPYTEDGTPVDIILNPLGIVGRMNLGQILETHLGLAAHKLGYKVATPVFNSVTIDQIQEELVKAGYDKSGKVQLIDGRTGDKFDTKTVIGYKYMLKLVHMVDDKIHARSSGKYAKVTQQPLGGKAMGGGQRFGEMEVWALEAHGAAHTLQEMLTIKSDDVQGRSKAYESIVKNEPIKGPRLPESFNVLVNELKSLGLSVTLNTDDSEEEVEVIDEVKDVEKVTDEAVIEAKEKDNKKGDK